MTTLKANDLVTKKNNSVLRNNEIYIVLESNEMLTKLHTFTGYPISVKTELLSKIELPEPQLPNKVKLKVLQGLKKGLVLVANEEGNKIFNIDSLPLIHLENVVFASKANNYNLFL